MRSAAEVRRIYRRQVARAGGTWYAYLSLRGEPILDERADQVVPGYSVQKVAVAAAILARADDGALCLADTVELTAADVLPGSGCYALQPVWGDRLTVANVLTALLLVSDNTAVRLCGRFVPPPQLNAALAGLGFKHTRVEAEPGGGARFGLGVTTPRETHDLLARLAARTLLSPASCDFLLGVLRAPGGYHDGIRRRMSSAERARVATKYAADRNAGGAARHEAGVMSTVDGRPAVGYALFADGLGSAADYGGTHPAVLAHAALGRVLFDTMA
jgi:beta-lactamase class A